MVKITDIVTKLLERTKQGKVDWKPTATEQAFIAVIGNSSVWVSSRKSSLKGVGEPYEPVLQIYDRAGHEIERLSETSEDYYGCINQLEELYRIARHAALKVDNQLGELLKTLETST